MTAHNFVLVPGGRGHGGTRAHAMGYRGGLYSVREFLVRSHADLARDRLHPQRDRSRCARGDSRLLRSNHPAAPRPAPRDTDYASVFESDVPIIVQHTRLDSRRAELALLST